MSTPGGAPLHVFLSYAAEQAGMAEQIYFRLASAGHRVFFDRTSLPPGEEYDGAIREAVRSSDLMVFLISPSSVADGSYTRTELQFARGTWPNPAGRVLPVLVAETDFSRIPAYLAAVTVLRPEGNVPAEVAAAVADRAAGWSPGDTITRKLQSITDEAERMERVQMLADLDREWGRTLKKYEIRVNGQAADLEPSRGLALVPLLLCLGFGAAILLFPAGPPTGAEWAFAFLIVLCGVVTAFWVWNAAEDYNAARERYERRRRDIQSGAGKRRGVLRDL